MVEPLCEQADGAPQGNHDTDRDEPPRTSCPEFTLLILGLVAPAVFVHGIEIADQHRQAEGERELFDEQIEIEEFFHTRKVIPPLHISAGV